jgi:hypothetical protein
MIISSLYINFLLNSSVRLSGISSCCIYVSSSLATCKFCVCFAVGFQLFCFFRSPYFRHWHPRFRDMITGGDSTSTSVKKQFLPLLTTVSSKRFAIYKVGGSLEISPSIFQAVRLQEILEKVSLERVDQLASSQFACCSRSVLWNS